MKHGILRDSRNDTRNVKLLMVMPAHDVVGSYASLSGIGVLPPGDRSSSSVQIHVRVHKARRLPAWWKNGECVEKKRRYWKVFVVGGVVVVVSLVWP